MTHKHVNKYQQFSDDAQRKRREERACGEKVVYDTKQLAEHKMNHRTELSYQCTFCGKWHRTRSIGRLVKQHYHMKSLRNRQWND